MARAAKRRRFILSTGGVEKFTKDKLLSAMFLFFQPNSDFFQWL